MGVYMYSDKLFVVQEIGSVSQKTVDLEKMTCSCLQFQEYMLPCSHVCAVITSKHLNISHYCNPAYFATSLREVYKGIVVPIHTSLLEKDTLLPPKVVPQAGRPRKIR